MCAMVPCTPVVVTLPLTEPSSATRMLPEPDPEALTGGTSSAPLSLTLMALLPGIQLGMLSEYVAQEASASAVMPAAAILVRVFLVMGDPPLWAQTAGGLEYSHAPNYRV